MALLQTKFNFQKIFFNEKNYFVLYFLFYLNCMNTLEPIICLTKLIKPKHTKVVLCLIIWPVILTNTYSLIIAISSPACLWIGPLSKSKSVSLPGDLSNSFAALRGSKRLGGFGKRSILWNNASRTGRRGLSLPTNLTTCMPMLKII